VELVIDTSALVAVIASEPEREALIRRTRGAVLLAPASVHWEVGNALAAAIKRRRADLRDVLRALSAYERIALRLLEVPLADALAMCAEHHIYAYDAYVLACARRQHCPILTLDRGLARAATAAGLDVLEVA
jgi:predicted nucleic acid-binding protein